MCTEHVAKIANWVAFLYTADGHNRVYLFGYLAACWYTPFTSAIKLTVSVVLGHLGRLLLHPMLDMFLFEYLQEVP